MRKIILLFILLCIQNINSQSINAKLDKVSSIIDAEKFVKDNPELIPEIYTFYPEIDTLVPSYFKTLKVGNIITENESTLKIISVNKRKAFRASYIYFDGNKLSINEINKLRSTIIAKYKKGAEFPDLAEKYTMDGNTKADLYWFTEDMMVPEFVNAIKNHNKGEIFTIDVPDNKWYYVTLKTYDEILVSEITLLKIKS